MVTATTVPTGLNVNIPYNRSATVPVNAGSYPIISSVVGDNVTGSKTGTLIRRSIFILTKEIPENTERFLGRANQKAILRI